MSNDTQVQAHMALVDKLCEVTGEYHALDPDYGAPSYEVVSEARAAVEASARQLAEQPGFVMVPVLPDEWPPEFITWFQNLPDLKAEQVWPLYQAARPLTASPTAPSTEASEPVRDEREREAFQEGYEAAQADAKACDLPPLGWSCTRTRGHAGPCAAVESPDDAKLVADGMKRLKGSP